MPLEIESKENTPLIEVKSSVAIEIIAAIHYLSDRKHHDFPEKLGSSMLNSLSSNSLKVLKALSGMRLQGLEMFEFVVKEEAFDDIELLINNISGYDDANFIYTILGEVLVLDTINKIMEDSSELNKALLDNTMLAKNNFNGLEFLFYNTKTFKSDVVNLIKEVNNSIFLDKLNSLKGDYDKNIEKTWAILKDKKPIDVSQEILERQFKRIIEFKKYYFVPSYFVSPHKIRVFCGESHMVVFALEQNDEYVNQVGDRISLVFKIISDRTRIELLRAIIEEPTYGKLLAEKLNLTTATISHHVEVLKSINLITEKRKKNIKYFEANEEEIRKIFNEGIEYLFNK